MSGWPHLPEHEPHPMTVGASVIELGSTSSGSMLLDGALGGLVGSLVAPTAAARLGYIIGGALAGSLAGVFGLAGVVLYSRYKTLAR